MPYYSCPAFGSLSWLRHGFSTRRGFADEGVFNPDSGALERVNENHRGLLRVLGLENPALISLNQSHSDRVCVVETGYREFSAARYEGDALVTNTKNSALTIKTADCFPILIADPVHRAVGAVHSGWRGTLLGILPGTIREMRRRFQSDPARLLFALGPGIRECCFEVGEDVARLFIKTYPEKSTARPHPAAPGKYLVNLASVLRTQMTQSGVPLENQHDSGMCTCCNTRDFFSWRAEGATAGRMMSVIAIV